MGFETPQPLLSQFVDWTTDGTLQLPDFQRGYKWDEERIRSLLVTVLRGHPLGVVMMLKTGNDQIRFKPRLVEGVSLSSGVEPRLLLLDGQQRLTSLTQSLKGTGVVATKDAKGKLIDRCFYIDIDVALQGDDRIDDAVVTFPADRVVRRNFGKDVERDLSSEDLEREQRMFPARLLLDQLEAALWLNGLEDRDLREKFMKLILKPVNQYTLPAIQLDEYTSKAAVATVFEKVNTGGLSLNAFELLTATFAGDREYYERTGTDFRLNEDWHETQRIFAAHPALSDVESTDFLQAVTLLATWERQRSSTSARRPAVSAKREDILKLTLQDYLQWVEPLRRAFIWCSTFLADHYIFTSRFLPYPKQLVSLAVIKVALGKDADLRGVRAKLSQWFWCGILGELYSGTVETRFVRDLEQVPSWATGSMRDEPGTVAECIFQEYRLYTLRTRGAAAYKGIYALILSQGARDWMHDQSFDKVQYTDLAVDIHHVFPKKWCDDNEIPVDDRESIVNKTPLSAFTNRSIGAKAPSKYLKQITAAADIETSALDSILGSHGIEIAHLEADDFYEFFYARTEFLIQAIESATGKSVVRYESEDDENDEYDEEDDAVSLDEEAY